MFIIETIRRGHVQHYMAASIYDLLWLIRTEGIDRDLKFLSAKRVKLITKLRLFWGKRLTVISANDGRASREWYRYQAPKYIGDLNTANYHYGISVKRKSCRRYILIADDEFDVLHLLGDLVGSEDLERFAVHRFMSVKSYVKRSAEDAEAKSKA